MTEKENLETKQIQMVKNLEISLHGEYRCISLTKDAVRLLGCPKFICLRVNKAYNSIMLKPCEREDPMSYKVPENFLKKHNCVFRIHAQTFVRTILDANGFDPMGTYAFHSMYLPDKNSIIVPLNNPKRDSTIETDDVETAEEES